MNALSFDYTIIRSRTHSIVIRIKPDGAVHVHCPPAVSIARIDEIVRGKAAWIESKLREIRNRPPVIPFTDRKLADLTALAKKEVPRHVAFYAAQMGVSYGRITIRHQKSRWGSCSSKNNLNFNCLMMLAPPDVRNYIIIHELCHLKQMNHSPAFWQEVERIMPGYRAAKQWLKEHGAALIRRLPA